MQAYRNTSEADELLTAVYHQDEAEARILPGFKEALITATIFWRGFVHLGVRERSIMTTEAGFRSSPPSGKSPLHVAFGRCPGNPASRPTTTPNRPPARRVRASLPLPRRRRLVSCSCCISLTTNVALTSAFRGFPRFCSAPKLGAQDMQSLEVCKVVRHYGHQN